MKNVLVLGAGFVAEPLIEYLSGQNYIQITIVIDNEITRLCNHYPNCIPLHLDVIKDEKILDNAIKESKIVICLLPDHFHEQILKKCIKNKVNMVTASYCSPAMRKLQDKIIECGITVINEVGLDPGIDHLLAMECFQEVNEKGGTVDSFVSYCGGLSAPEFSENPLKYKFTWNPKRALLNTKAGARYLKDDEVIDISSGGELLDSVEPFDFFSDLSLEGIPNRDSTIYRNLYNIPNAKTIFRGSLRYKNHCDIMKGFILLGLLDDKPHSFLSQQNTDITWRSFICALLQVDVNISHENLRKNVLKIVGSTCRVDALEMLGFFEDEPIYVFSSPLDALSEYLAKKLSLKKDERDLVVLYHQINITWPNGLKEEREISLVCYGVQNGFSAMSKTVGYTVAIATIMVLEGDIGEKGLVLPFKKDLVKKMLLMLAQLGIKPKIKKKFIK